MGRDDEAMSEEAVGIKVGSAPDSWGVWFADDPRQTPWHRFLDEIAEAGYEWLELGPYGYLPTGAATLRGELDRRGLKVSAAMVMDAPLEEPSSWPALAAAAAAAGGTRVFTASSSQGLLFGMEVLFTIPGWRVPLVLVNVSRALATPITLEPDHNDVLAARDCGMIQLYAETCQEVLDYILIAYRVAEDPGVCLPVLVNMDGFYLSFTREPVALPDEKEVRNFLPDFKAAGPVFQASQPHARASAVFGGNTYTYFKIQNHLAILNAEKVFCKVAEEFGDRFGRYYHPVEEYRLGDADYVFVMSNSFSTKGKGAVNMLRGMGIKAGLLKICMFRPFPKEALAKALCGRAKVAVIDQNISLGAGGITFPEIASALYGLSSRPERLLSVIGGLGGKDIRDEDFLSIIDKLDEDGFEGPLILFDKNDMEQFLKLQELSKPGREARMP